MTTLMRYREAFTRLGRAPKDETGTHARHVFGLATEADGSVIVYCEECDTDYTNATHCCEANRGPWGLVCKMCETQDWYLDLCEAYWTSRQEC